MTTVSAIAVYHGQAYKHPDKPTGYIYGTPGVMNWHCMTAGGTPCALSHSGGIRHDQDARCKLLLSQTRDLDEVLEVLESHSWGNSGAHRTRYEVVTLEQYRQHDAKTFLAALKRFSDAALALDREWTESDIEPHGGECFPPSIGCSFDEFACEVAAWHGEQRRIIEDGATPSHVVHTPHKEQTDEERRREVLFLSAVNNGPLYDRFCEAACLSGSAQAVRVIVGLTLTALESLRNEPDDDPTWCDSFTSDDILAVAGNLLNHYRHHIAEVEEHRSAQ